MKLAEQVVRAYKSADICDPLALECFSRPESDPESFESNKYFMNREWVIWRIHLRFNPKDMVEINGPIQSVKKIIADEMKEDDSQFIDISNETLKSFNLATDTPSLVPYMHEKKLKCLVFFPLSCTDKSLLNFVYSNTDIERVPLDPGLSVKHQHTEYFLNSVHTYTACAGFKSFLCPQIEACPQMKRLFIATVTGKVGECCICMEDFTYESNRPTHLCVVCSAYYCEKCTKQLKKGRRKVVKCIYCRQPIKSVASMIAEYKSGKPM